MPLSEWQTLQSIHESVPYILRATEQFENRKKTRIKRANDFALIVLLFVLLIPSLLAKPFFVYVHDVCLVNLLVTVVSKTYARIRILVNTKKKIVLCRFQVVKSIFHSLLNDYHKASVRYTKNNNQTLIYVC